MPTPPPGNSAARSTSPAAAAQPRSIADAIARVERFARLFDRMVGIPGSDVGIGLDALLGFLVPFVGDLGTGLASLYVVVEAIRARVPAIVIARMLLNIGIDELIGWIPIAGDIGDIFFQSNLMNLKLLRAHAGGGRSTTREWIIVGGTLLVVLTVIALPVGLASLAFFRWLGH